MLGSYLDLIRNGRFGGQGPPGGDDEDLAPEPAEAETRQFLTKILIGNGRFGGQGPPGGDDGELAQEPAQVPKCAHW